MYMPKNIWTAAHSTSIDQSSKKFNGIVMCCLNLRWYSAGNWQTGASDYNGRLARVQHWWNALERIFDGGTTMLGTRIPCPFPARTFPYHTLWSINPHWCISNILRAEPGLCRQTISHCHTIRHLLCKSTAFVTLSGIYNTLSPQKYFVKFSALCHTLRHLYTGVYTFVLYSGIYYNL